MAGANMSNEGDDNAFEVRYSSTLLVCSSVILVGAIMSRVPIPLWGGPQCPKGAMRLDKAP